METLTTLSDVALEYSDCRTAGISRRADVAKKVFFFQSKNECRKMPRGFFKKENFILISPLYV